KQPKISWRQQQENDERLHARHVWLSNLLRAIDAAHRERLGKRGAESKQTGFSAGRALDNLLGGLASEGRVPRTEGPCHDDPPGLDRARSPKPSCKTLCVCRASMRRRFYCIGELGRQTLRPRSRGAGPSFGATASASSPTIPSCFANSLQSPIKKQR